MIEEAAEKYCQKVVGAAPEWGIKTWVKEAFIAGALWYRDEVMGKKKWGGLDSCGQTNEQPILQ